MAAAFCGLLLTSACPVREELDLRDDVVQYIESPAYRRGVLERDLTETNNDYARERLGQYGLPGLGWDVLGERDPASRALTVLDVQRLQAGASLEDLGLEGAALEGAGLEGASSVGGSPLGRRALTEPGSLSDDEWVELGRQVFFELPLRADRNLEILATQASEGEATPFEEVGFLREPHPDEPTRDELVSLRVFRDEAGAVRLGHSCAQCHASRNAAGELSAVRSNRDLDYGAIRLRAQGLEPGDLPPELDATPLGDLDRLGPGRTDVLGDSTFNPYAFPDLGGLVDMPFLHHNANWVNTGHATLAIRCETLYITSSNPTARIPRALSWAIAAYYRSLPPPPRPELELDADAVSRGEEQFEASGCVGCHAPPLYTSDRWVEIETIGTDDAAGMSAARFSGAYRIPSLRGVGGNAPYLHHGAFATLEEMFDPDREEPGHAFGLELEPADRADLLAFLRSL